MKLKVNGKSAWWVILLNVLLVLLIIYCITHIIFLKNYTGDSSTFQLGGLMTSKSNNLKNSDDNKIDMVSSLDDNLENNNTAWCGTFQVVWNEMSDKVVGKDIIFFKMIPEVENLNKRSFNIKDVSEDSIYVNCGLLTLDRKAEIERSIKEKFEKESKILDKLDWSNAPQSDDDYLNSDVKNYISYSMLYKKFEFSNAFDSFENRTFKKSDGKEISDVDYFGIDENSSKSLDRQVDVLYYKNKNEFAVTLDTTGNDEVILAKGYEGNSFKEIYEYVKEREALYTGRGFGKEDKLYVPKLNLSIEKEFDKLIADDESKGFYTAKKELSYITAAIQTLDLKLDENGGEVLSEAAMTMISFSSIEPERNEPREFDFNSKFVMFIKEKDKQVPYVAITIDNMELFK